MTLVGAGLVGPISPGSIISVVMMSPKGKTLLLVTAVLIAALVTFVTSSLIIALSSKKDEKLPENRFTPKYKQNKPNAAPQQAAIGGAIRHIVFSCDAGMGSSALGATRFRKRLEAAGVTMKVSNSSVNSIPADADVVVCQQGLVSRAQGNAPSVRIVAITNFLDDPALDALQSEVEAAAEVKTVAALQTTAVTKPSVLTLENIRVGATAADKWEAISAAGELLVAGGYVDQSYVEAMKEREKITTTYLGMGIAIPHGTDSAKQSVHHSGITIVQYPEGVDFDGEKAYLVIGIAGVGDEHLELLARVSEALEDEDTLERLKSTADAAEIYNVLNA